MTVPEVLRLLARLVWGRLRSPDDVLGWSRWRRAHQHRARACHYRTCGARPPT